jgi:hypothetical protein
MMPPRDTRTVWKRVKEALNEAGLPSTQVKAAKLIGCEQGSISDWNKPGRYPTLENAETVAQATNTCVQWLMDGRGPKHPGPPEEPAAEELWSLWGRLSDRKKGELLGLAKGAINDHGAHRHDDEVPRELHRGSGRSPSK